jgi:AbiV family abortive infection protein
MRLRKFKPSGMNVNDEILKAVAKKSMQNAESLMSDADLLREAKRHQRAYALYQFAMEEVGKAISSVLLLALIDPTEKDIKEYRDGFTRHRYKIKKSRALDTFICQVLYKGDYDGAMAFLQSSMAEDEKHLDVQKNKSLYTEIISDKVMMPLEMVDETSMNYIWNRAVTRYKMAQPFIDILVKHYCELREHQHKNGSIRSMSLDTEEAAKEFWDEILDKD